jgi:Uma2 family endonuclease
MEHAMSSTTTISWEEYQKLPEGISTEYVDGRAVVIPPPTRRHQRAARRIANFIEAVDPAAVSVDTEWGWKPGEDEFVPDVLVTRPTHEELRYTGTPLLVVEVLSSNRAHDLVTKRSKYAAAGLPRYWTIDPHTETVTALALVDGAYRQIGSVRGTDEAVWEFGAGSVRIRPADLFV